MAGLNEQQLKDLKKAFQERRDSFFAGPRLPGSESNQVLREVEARAQQAEGGSLLDRFAELARLRRAVRPNPLK